MKKYLLMLGLLWIAISASAQDLKSYAIWPENQEGCETIPTTFGFWSGKNEIMEENGVSFYRYSSSNDPETWLGGGFQVPGTYDLTSICNNDYDLVFDVRKSGEEIDFHIKIEVGSNVLEKPFPLEYKSEWTTMRVNLKEHYSQQFSSYTNGTAVYLFIPIANRFEGGNITPGEYIDFTNVRLEPANGEGDNQGGGNTGGEETQGATFTGSFTDIYNQSINGESNDYPYNLNYTITYNEDKTLTIKVSFDWPNGSPIGGENFVYIFPEKEGEVHTTSFEITTKQVYEPNEVINIHIKWPVANGAVEKDILYTVGSSNTEQPGPDEPKVVLTASAQDITDTSASIAYDVALPEGYEDANVTVTYNEEVAQENPILLTGLTESTDYSYTLVATAEKEGMETLTSDEVVVSFRTLRDPSKEIHNYQIVNGFFKNVIKNGEEESKRRRMPVSMKSDVVYNPDKTLTIHFTMSGAEDILGIVPQVNIADEYSGNRLITDNGHYSFTTTKTFEEGQEVLIFYYHSYNGGVERFELNKFKVGESNEPVEYGEPAAIILQADNTFVGTDTPTPFLNYLIDANGNFLLTETPKVLIHENNADADLDGEFITLFKMGDVTLKSTYEKLVAYLTFESLTSKGANNIASGIIPTVEGTATENLFNATDGNEGTETVFICNETEEHTMKIDLGKNYIVQLVKIIWEGASATVYDLSLEEGNGESEIQTLSEPFKYYVTDNEGGGGLTIRNNIDVPNVKSRYLTLHTQKAFEKAWNIKIKEIEVYGIEVPESMDQIYLANLDALGAKEFDGEAIHIDELISAAYGKSLDDLDIKVHINPIGLTKEKNYNYNNIPGGVDENVWEEWKAIEQYDQMTGTFANNVDGLLIYDPNGSIDDYGNARFEVGCSGQFEIVVSSPYAEFILNEGEGVNVGNRYSQILEVYPSIYQKFSYSLDNETFLDKGLTINNWPMLEGNKIYVAYYEYEEKGDKLPLHIPGLYNADVYYALESQLHERNERSAKRHASSTTDPTAYGYTKVTDNTIDLSSLTEDNNSSTLYFVLSKNGVSTPIKEDGKSETYLAVTAKEFATSVEEIESELTEDAVYYNLQGLKVNPQNLDKGIYIVRQGNTSKKVIIK